MSKLKQFIPAFWLLFVTMAVYTLWPHLYKLPVPDESTYIYEGWRMAQGELPYLDFFDFVFPGIYMLVAAVVKTVGFQLVILRLLAVFALLVCVGGTVYLARDFLPKRWLIVLGLLMYCACLPDGLQVYHHVFSSAFAVLVVVCFDCWLVKRNTSWLCLAAVMAGLSMVFTQSLGGFMILGLFLAVWVYQWKAEKKSLPASFGTALFGLCVSAIPVGFVCWFFQLNGGLGAFYEATVSWMLKGGYAKTTSIWYSLDIVPVIVNYFSELLIRLDYQVVVIKLLLVIFLPLLGLLWPIEFFGHKPWKTVHWRLMAIWVLGAAMFLASFSLPTSLLVAYHGGPLYALAFILIYKLLKNRPVIEERSVSILMVILVLFMFLKFQESLALREQPVVVSFGTVEKHLITPGRSPELVHNLNEMVQYVHGQSSGKDDLFVYNLSPEFYMLTDRHNPTRYQLLMSIYNTDAQIEEAGELLHRQPPEFMVYDQLDRQYFSQDPRFEAYRGYDYHLKHIEALIQSQYQKIGQAGRHILFQKQRLPVETGSNK